MDEHFGPAMEAFDLEFEKIDEVLSGTWATTLWGCAFEDFFTRRFEPDGRNPVEAYLQRRGWKEAAAARRYMTALQSSVMSLYEVSDLTPGQSLRARDLIRGGEPVLVSERSATQTLKPWDRIAARIVPQGDQLVLAGGLLAFTLEGSELLTTTLQDGLARGGGAGSVGRAASGQPRRPLDGSGRMTICGELHPCSRRLGSSTSCRTPWGLTNRPCTTARVTRLSFTR